MSATLWILFEILQNLCYLCACVPKIRLNPFKILKISVISVPASQKFV
jgi:hypothetical protein